ncbi:MAG: zinc-binding dehydrogenase [Prevotellaceae bacterium]|jgi:threonine dehydrogenase-like Zn-dependent dehydrogenase|nr:zinc-binding dehydrogenase [Prevotellaceae bacterium]
MKTTAVRLYGKNDLRLEEFELPPVGEGEILAKVVCDSICMSSYKATHEADVHKRVPRNIAQQPTIIGHEFAGEVVEVGSRWKGAFAVGDKFSIQPALNFAGGPVGVLSAPGYSYRYVGGDATYVVIPAEVMEHGCLLHYTGRGYYPASLSEPLSCVIGAMHASYHTTPGSYVHSMEIVQGGAMAILAGVGPMGLAAVSYAIHRHDRKPRLLVVTDIDQARLDRAAQLYSPHEAALNGIELRYVNTGATSDPTAQLRELTGGHGYDDVMVFAPVAAVVEQADTLLANDGCLNFFAGPAKTDFKALFNFYNVHYASTHVVGTSGGNTDDMKEALALMSEGLDPAGLVTHVGGLNAVIDTTLNLPQIPGGKKLIYTHVNMPLTPIADFAARGKSNPAFAELARLCEQHNGLWNVEAEACLLSNAAALSV